MRMVMMPMKGVPGQVRMIWPAATASPLHLCGRDLQLVYGASKAEEVL
jgi:hypothetical protein